MTNLQDAGLDIGTIEWSTRSPDWTPLAHFLMGYWKTKFFKIGRLIFKIQKTKLEWNSIVFHHHLGACQVEDGRHFQHLLRNFTRRLHLFVFKSFFLFSNNHINFKKQSVLWESIFTIFSMSLTRHTFAFGEKLDRVAAEILREIISFYWQKIRSKSTKRFIF